VFEAEQPTQAPQLRSKGRRSAVSTDSGNEPEAIRQRLSGASESVAQPIPELPGGSTHRRVSFRLVNGSDGHARGFLAPGISRTA
jgi:hypothetical protein